ncbi:MAG: hypothetical protein DWC07_01190 [Candidatus Poseidoniales archaeon]|nr:MAG: hypothetical protein DWC07_01190 [Candidatus Poseidoniales archaeon]
MAGFGGMRKGREEARTNLGYTEGGDCPRCGGSAEDSSMTGYLQCTGCQHEWPDPNHVEERKGPEPPSHKRDAELIEQFKSEMASGELANVLGVSKDLTGEQEQSLKRLEDRWMSGMQGHFNAASEERKPLMISFDDDDNIMSTEVGAITIVSNGFDGGEEIRLEYPGRGTEFYAYNERSPTGWKRGRNAEATARSIASVINRSSRLVYANLNNNRVSFELRDSDLKPASFVIFVDDPGGTDIVAEKGGVVLDHRDFSTLQDYRNVVEMVLEDGIISPSEDQLLWAMREQLNIDEAYHVQMVIDICGEQTLKECTSCGSMAELYPEYAAWYCHSCEAWC